MGRTLAETAHLNSPETMAADAARDAVARASETSARTEALTRRHGLIFTSAAVAIILVVLIALLLPAS